MSLKNTPGSADARTRARLPTSGTANPGEGLLADVLSRLTGRPICIEDAFGHISAAAGTGSKRPYPRLGAAARSRTAQLWLASGSPVPEPRRLVALALSHGEVLGAICMLATDRPVTAGNVFALKYATRLLEVELSHRRSLARLELRLGRDLVDELVSGTDGATAGVRTEALGYDISGLQHVIVAQWQPPRTDDTVVVALRRTFRELRSSALVSRRADMAVAVVRGDPLGAEVFSVVAKTLRSATGAVGVGGRSWMSPKFRAPSRKPCTRCTSGPVRSDRYAVSPALINSGSTASWTQLGANRIWPAISTSGSVPFNAPTTAGGLTCMQTLAQYLDHGGNYDSTAQSLTIHRSTLRYRLKSIRQITGFDLADPETRLNLHVATRAWRLRPHGALFTSV